jgi:serine/threonine protein kinase
MGKSFTDGWIEEWQGNRGIIMTLGTGASFFVREYNLEPAGHDLPVKEGEEVAFEWVHEGKRMIVTKAVRRRHAPLPDSWAREEWPPAAAKWLPKKRLGRGGNGEVWLANDEHGDTAAIKYLHRIGGDGYKRFKVEIGVLISLGHRRGILPLLDHHLPAGPSLTDPAWLATPLAEPFRDDARLDTLEKVISAFAQISETLSQLAEEGISHRDIKPDNLFWLGEQPVVGDFGLVDFPGKPALTIPFRKLGPLFYIAPEMLFEPHRADGRAADVYSLAKTLWVTATGLNYPIPGEQRDSVPQTRLSTYVAHRRARQLDRLIARCTSHSPRNRPTMADVSRELRFWLEKTTSSLRPRHPRRLSEAELAKVAVQLTDPERIILHCNVCWTGWSPNILPGGKLPRLYWRCPNGCNSE